MKRHYYRNDELLASALFGLAFLLILAFLVSWKLVGENTFDYEMILFLILGGIVFVYFGYAMTLYLISNYKSIIQYEFRYDDEYVRHFYRWNSFSFSEVKLYALDKKHHILRIFYRRHIHAFQIKSNEYDVSAVLTENEMKILCKYAEEVSTSMLNSYGVFAAIVAAGVQIIYMFYLSKSDARWLNALPYQLYIVMAINILFVVGVTWFNRRRLHLHYEKILQAQKDTSEN